MMMMMMKLILRNINAIVATRCHYFKAKMHQTPLGELTALPQTLLGPNSNGRKGKRTGGRAREGDGLLLRRGGKERKKSRREEERGSKEFCEL